MTIYGTSEIMVISKSSEPSKDGTKTYYRLAVLAGTEAGMLPCSKELYDSVKVGETYDFETAYNDTYKSFRLNRLLTAAKKQ